MSSINYLQVLSKEESERLDRETDAFLLSLDSNTKGLIKSLVERFQSQIECEHQWIDPNTYENDLPKDRLFCRCGATKLTDEAKKKQQEELINKYKWKKL